MLISKATTTTAAAVAKKVCNWEGWSSPVQKYFGLEVQEWFSMLIYQVGN
jgi:hypothetical protein